MSIWAIADLHASRTDSGSGAPSKPMDVFGPQWSNHIERFEDAWREMVGVEDTVIVAGDIDWGLNLSEAAETLERIEQLPGQKILLRGNHDYWWSSKTTNRVRRALGPSTRLLHNDALQVEGFNICGAKGSPVPGGIEWTPDNEKLLNREVQRLRASLGARVEDLPTIVALHYPPFYAGHPQGVYRDVLDEAQVRLCVYGHLHGGAARTGPTGIFGATEYVLIAADSLQFRPLLIAEHGALATYASVGVSGLQ